MKTTHYHVNSISAAWAKVNEVFPTDYNKDENSSARAGYPVFRSSVEYYNYICDLGDRLEVNLESGETKQFIEYEEFIENWRFWFAAGKPYKSDEETFTKMVESLKAFYVDGASLEILLNGLYVKMIFHRWK